MIKSTHRTSMEIGEESGGQRRRSLWLWLALFAGLVLMFLLDAPVMHAVGPLRNGRLDHILLATVRWLGNGRFQVPVLLLLIVFGALFNRRLLRAGEWGLAAFAISGIACNVIKVLVHRARPWVTSPEPTTLRAAIRAHDYQSFPSGDASTAFAIVLAIGVIFPRARIPLLLIGVAVAVERVLVNVHHPSDVWAGALVGLATVQLMQHPPRLTRQRLKEALPFLLLGVFAAAILLLGLGSLPLFGRDESLYAEAAREMHASGDWIFPRVNAQPFLEKPPLYYWLAAASYHAFGTSPLSARLPAALLGLATVLLVAWIGTRVWGRRAGLLAGLTLATSLQVAFIGRMGIMDVPLMFLVTVALLCYAGWRRRGDWWYAAGFGALVGLAVLLKAMAGLVPVLVVIAHSVLYRQEPRRPWVLPFLLAAAVCALVAGPWFALLLRDPAFRQILFHENLTRMGKPMQGHGGLPIYYFALILISFFPWIMLLPAAMGRRHPEPTDEAELWRTLSIVWFAAVIVPISLISTKLPGYVTPLFPALALLVGPELERRWRRPERAPWIAIIVLAVVLIGVVCSLPHLAARLAAKVGATEDLRKLVAPSLWWAGAYGIIIVGAVLALANRPKVGTQALVVGQAIALAAIFAGILPLLAPYMEGSREYRLAEIARRELPQTRVVLYATRPEAVDFVLGHPVQTYDRDQQSELLDDLARGPAALLAPTGEQDKDFWRRLPVRRKWQVGDRVLLDVQAVSALARVNVARTASPSGRDSRRIS